MSSSCFIYKDTFISLLNLIWYLIENKIKPDNIRDTYYHPNLFDDIIELDIEENEDVINKITKVIGNYTFRYLYYVFLSTDGNKALIIYYLILNGLKYKEKVLYHRNLKCVNKTLDIANYVSHEIHKYKGFIRFKELKNHILYAEIEPVNDILSVVSNHFQNRLKNEYWLIKDVKRGIISIYDKKNYYLVSEKVFSLDTSVLSEQELNIEEMWQTFYRTIGIEKRKNERCRMNFMPKKYWKYMIEMEEEL